jgi:hypothetical protein
MYISLCMLLKSSLSTPASIVAKMASIVVRAGQLHTNRLITPIKLILRLGSRFKWTITLSLTTIMSNKKGNGRKYRFFFCGPFQWPYRCSQHCLMQHV